MVKKISCFSQEIVKKCVKIKLYHLTFSFVGKIKHLTIRFLLSLMNYVKTSNNLFSSTLKSNNMIQTFFYKL